MKKLGYIGILILLMISVAGCSEESQKRQAVFEEYAKQYYEKYGKTYSVDEYEVTLKSLRKVAKENNYALESLSTCKESSKATIELEHQKISNIRLNLNCEE